VRTEQLERAIDAAKNRLERIDKAETDASERIRTILNELALAAGVSNMDRALAIEDADNVLAVMTLQLRQDIAHDLSRYEDMLDNAEYYDLHRSGPVVI
jgi:hypothetical protein